MAGPPEAPLEAASASAGPGFCLQLPYLPRRVQALSRAASRQSFLSPDTSLGEEVTDTRHAGQEVWPRDARGTSPT